MWYPTMKVALYLVGKYFAQARVRDWLYDICSEILEIVSVKQLSHWISSVQRKAKMATRLYLYVEKRQTAHQINVQEVQMLREKYF